jgi:hypothetical protein
MPNYKIGVAQRIEQMYWYEINAPNQEIAEQIILKEHAKRGKSLLAYELEPFEIDDEFSVTDVEEYK